MLAVIYHLKIVPGKEESFRHYWNRLAHYLIDSKGALGSSLHQSENGEWVAYSRWPSREIKEASWPHNGSIHGFSKEMEEVVRQMQICIEKKQEPIYLKVVDDLLFKKGIKK